MRMVLCTIAFICLGYVHVIAINHYVYKKAVGKNDGSSWVDAWQSFSAINWDNIKPGDVIYISGGVDSLVYTEQFHVSASGTAGNPILITSSNEINHSGKVIIDTYQNYVNCLDIYNKQFVIVNNLFLRNSYDCVIKIKDSQNLRIENCTIHMTAASGILIFSSQNINISHCKLTTDILIDHQTDGIYSQDNVENIYENNYIVINNRDSNGHNDCVQSYRDDAITIRNNYTEQNNSKTSNAQGIYISTPLGSDTTRIYNNIFNSTLASSNGITFNGQAGNTSARVQIINNTVYGESLSSQYRLLATFDPIIKNNIGYSKTGNSILFSNNVNFSDASNVNNNIWKSNDNDPIIVNGSEKSWTSWQDSGFDLNSYRVNPMFNNISSNDFTLQASSIGIDNGQALYPPYNVDFAGVSRHQGSGWDIGAYENKFTPDSSTKGPLPTEFQLFQNFPNPFNPSTKIKYIIPFADNISIRVYNSTGELIRELINEYVDSGTYTIEFSSKDLSSGIYYYQLISSKAVISKKMVIVK